MALIDLVTVRAGVGPSDKVISPVIQLKVVQNSLFEHLCDFFQGEVLGLNHEEVDNNGFKGVPDRKYKVY